MFLIELWFVPSKRWYTKCRTSKMTKGRAIATPPMSNHTTKTHAFFLQSMFLLIFWPGPIQTGISSKESQLKYRVDTLAFGCAFCYGIVIPCCLLYLYGKQHMVLEVNRTRTVTRSHWRWSCSFDFLPAKICSLWLFTCAQVNAGYQGDLHLWLHDILGSTTKKISGKDDKFMRPLIAAASAYISVLYRGRVSGTKIRSDPPKTVLLFWCVQSVYCSSHEGDVTGKS